MVAEIKLLTLSCIFVIVVVGAFFCCWSFERHMAARCLNNTQAGARLANLYVLSCWLFSVTSRRFLTPFITHPFIVCELEGQEQWVIICPKKIWKLHNCYRFVFCILGKFPRKLNRSTLITHLTCILSTVYRTWYVTPTLLAISNVCYYYITKLPSTITAFPGLSTTANLVYRCWSVIRYISSVTFAMSTLSSHIFLDGCNHLEA